MRVVYARDWPDVARAAVEDVIAPALALIPRWVRRVDLFYARDKEGKPAEVESVPEYAGVGITFGAQFVEASPELRRQIAVHECVHTIFAPYDILIEDMAKVIGAENEALGKRFEEEARRTKERVCSDLEESLENWEAERVV